MTPAKRRRLGPPPSSAPETPQVEKPSARAAPRRAPTTAENTEEGKLGRLLAKIACWQKKLPKHPGAEESWLGRRVSRGEVHLGCKVCAAMHPPALAAGSSDLEDRRLLASFRLSASRARLHNLRRHMAGAPHRAAEEASLGSSPSVVVPPPADFQALWDRLGRPSTFEAQSRKRSTMEWCLLEALRDEERGKLARATTISIAMDERDNRLLVTYAACKGVEVVSGILAQIRDPGRRSEEVADCVLHAVRRLCTRRQPHAHMYKPKEAPKQMGQTARRILGRVEMFSADGAANEQVAGRLLHPSVERGASGKKLPNLKMVIRDKAHAARRLTQRTFKVDDKLADVQATMLFGEQAPNGKFGSSVAKMLRYSRPCAEIFEKELGRQRQPCREGSGPGGNVSHLGFAKQRFDNTARPLAVAIWNLDAVIATCAVIARDASIDQRFRSAARRFLDRLDPTWILLLGMMADASDEILHLVRFFDKEAFEVDAMASAVAQVTDTLQALFKGKGCLSTGFTRLCLEHLRTPKLVPRSDGTLRSVDGLRADMTSLVQGCLRRMEAWAAVVLEVMKTEFPDWELLAAFGVFQLADGPKSSLARMPTRSAPQSVGPWTRERLGALARQFGVPPGQLEAEFQDHHKIAQAEKTQHPEFTSMQAWQAALAFTTQRRTRQNWPSTALLPVAERYFVCPGSTAGIEQTFSWFKRCKGEQWHASESAEERLLVLTMRAHRSKDLPPRLLRGAQAVWAANFGVPRVRARNCLGVRAQVLVRNMKARRASTGAGWLADRRAQVAGEAQKLAAGGLAPSPQGGAFWTEKHAEEVRHQHAERLQRACAAVEEGTAEESAALGDDPRARADARGAFLEADRKRAKEAADKARRKAQACAVPATPRIHGVAVFLADGAKRALDTPPGAWARLRGACALREVVEQHMASVVVALDPAAPGDRVMVQAGLLGQTVCSPSGLSEKQSRGSGPLVQLRRAMRTPRFIFISAGCAAKHAPMLALMKATTQRAPNNRWRWFGPAQDEARAFLDRGTQRSGAHSSEVVTLVVPEEMGAADLARFPRKTSLRSFVKDQIWQIDMAQSQLGCCGR